MITSIKITNIAGIASFESKLGAVTTLAAGNGQGKTSFLDALRCLANSGHDPDILKAGAESGEVVATFDDGAQCRVRVTPKDTVRSWKPKDGKKWLPGREYIDRVIAAVNYDPLSFLDLKPREQVQRLLEVCDVRPSQEEVLEAVGDAQAEADAAPISKASSGLEMLDMLHKAIYEARTAVNTGAKQLEAHAAQLQQSLGPDAPEGQDWSKVVEERAEKITAAQEQQHSEMAAIREQFETAKASAAEKYAKACESIDSDINAMIRKLEEERAERKAREASTKEAIIESARQYANNQASTIHQKYGPDIQRLTTEHAVAQERADAANRAQGTRKAVEAAKASAAEKKAKSGTLTAALDRIAALKLKLAERLPIPGVMVSEGKIVREEGGNLVPFQRWNTADTIKFCLRLAMLKAGEGGFIVLDSTERFEDANLKLLHDTAERYAAERGIQFILAYVKREGGEMAVQGRLL